jgi:ribosomal protein S18 acetylase RimI-like enzyme
MPEKVTIRFAGTADDAALVALDVATCTIDTTPAPPPDPHGSFFAATGPNDTLVAEVDGAVAGYVTLGASDRIPSARHTLLIGGFAVDPACQRRGVGRALLEAAVTEARRRGARRLTLRVLSTNESARRLYEAGGFVGVLHEQFLLGGRYVDDVLMARAL